MSSYRCWVPDYGHSVDDGEIVRAKLINASDAAELYMERNFADWDYATNVDIAVQETNEKDEPVGSVRMFNVDVESVPHFRARECPRTSEGKP